MVFLSRDRVVEARARARTTEFESAQQKLEVQATGLSQGEVAVPDRQAGYYHEYFCPDHAVQLTYDPNEPTQHRCPVDGYVFTGEPYDSACLWIVNNSLAESARASAMLWQLTSESRYLEKAENILSAYAEGYADIPPSTKLHPSHPGRVTWSCLDESAWVIGLTWAFDLIRDELPTTVAERIEVLLLRPAAEVITHNMYRHIHNVACWNIAALGMIGVALSDRELIRFALEGEHGFARQMDHGVFDDGMWFEGSLSYHYYTLQGLMSFAMACANSEYDLRQNRKLKLMFEAPVKCAYPDLSLPATNDCWYFVDLLSECGHGISPAAAFHEVALSWYGDPAFAWLLNRTYSRTQRNTWEALFFGVDSIPASQQVRVGSVNLESSGLAVLRSDQSETDKRTCLLLKYGPYAGSHDHPDKLSLIVYANGERLSPDLGTPGYGIALNDTWYRQTISHNTVVIDGEPQGPCTGAAGRFAPPAIGQPGVAEASASWEDGCYAGVRMKRTVFLMDGYFVDVFSVTCRRSRLIDWVYHNCGALESGAMIEKTPPVVAGGPGYECLQNVKSIRMGTDQLLSFRLDRTMLDLHMLRTADSEVIVGEGPFNPASVSIPVVIVRRNASRTTFLSVFSVSSPDSEPRRTVRHLAGNLDEDGFARFSVEQDGEVDLWDLRQDASVEVPPLETADGTRVITRSME